jgi:hypothetical protein
MMASAGLEHRTLLNAAWSFPSQGEEFVLNPFFVAGDAVCKTNKLLLPLYQLGGRDNNGNNLLAAQGLLQDETTRTYVWWFTVAMPYLLGADTCRLIHTICMDGNREAWDAVRVAQARGVFHAKMKMLSCTYHKLLQGLQKVLPQDPNLLDQRVYRGILASLDKLATYYETENEAKSAFASLRAYALEGAHLHGALAVAFDVFLTKLEKDRDTWCYYAFIEVLRMKEITSNR